MTRDGRQSANPFRQRWARAWQRLKAWVWAILLGDTRMAIAPAIEPVETAEITPELIESTGMRRFFEVWREAAGSRHGAMPRRADIDILDLGSYIGEPGLLEVIDGGRHFR